MSKQNEKLFFDKLKEVFIGAKVEGKSGFINLMRMKSGYFDSIMQELVREITTKTKDFPDFREEMYDKLFTFFKTFFSESGSIYFRYTPLKSKVYEKVYSNQNDIALFWKTYMLYYVKTERLWNYLSINFETDEMTYKVNFDVSKLEHKADSQKREIIYELKEIQENDITFGVEYSIGGRKSKPDEILRELKKSEISVDEEELDRIFRIFEKQNEVDYFINKDAKGFLKEQFDLWLKGYLFDDESDFSERRLKELKALKDVCFKVIEFISQFEDELVKIWNKPKFVLGTNYIVTLDRLVKKEHDFALVESIINDEGFDLQKKEWEKLGLMKSFEKSKLYTDTLDGKRLSKEYEHLPIDTKYFDNRTKLHILNSFESLDEELDGWLIHSENYQALKTLLPKYEGRIKSVYIDPPYNTDASAILYKNNYKDSSWLTLMENRLTLVQRMLTPDGIICVAIDDEEFAPLNLLMKQIFNKPVGIAAVRSNPAGRKTKGKFAPAHEYAVFYGKSEDSIPGSLEKTEKSLARYPKKDEKGRFAWQNFIRSGSHDKRIDRPKLHYPIFVDDKNGFRIPKMKWVESERQYILEEKPKENEQVVYPIVEKDGVVVEKNWQRGHSRVSKEPDEFRIRRGEKGEISIDFKTRMDIYSLPITWWDDKKYASANYGAAEIKDLFGEKVFDYAKSLKLVQDCLKASSLEESEIVLDFFSGSATTAHAVMALNSEDKGKRKFIIVEMADYFKDIAIPRVKKVAYSFSWKNGKAQKADGKGIFCKYYDLEQYEMTLKKTVYRESHPFVDFDNKSIYQQYVFLKDQKLLDVMSLDYEKNRATVDLTILYPNVDLSETLSNLAGKKIKKANKDWVEFEDNERVEFDKLDFRRIKPLIWW
jgi:adenine specific DNA methylase Mod